MGLPAQIAEVRGVNYLLKEDIALASIKNITIPDLGGAADVVVIEVLVKSGDKIESDTPIVTLESDKATLEVPSTDAGVVKEVKVKVGDKVSTGSVLVTLETSAEQTAAVKPAAPIQEPKPPEKPVAQGVGPPQSATSEAATMPAPQVLTGTVQSSSDVHAGPGVRRLARELGVNLALIPGTGPKERIVKEDVQAYVKSQLSQLQNAPTSLPFAPMIDFAKFGPIESQALSRIKKISGKNLQRNWMMIPHVTQFGEADITSLDDFRQTQKEALEKQKIKLTPLVFIMKAVTASLKAFPHFNASLDASGENLVLKKYFHVGVAVDTPDGLVVPVIRDVDKKGLVDLAKELAQVSEKARNKQLMPNDMQGGCFSISSLGGIGGTAFTPIINYPEVAILGVSKTSYKPVYQDGAFVPRLMLPLSLSYDHRVIDGADGARFIMHLTTMLSDIRNLLL
jgi:pyruvate dehydrogenase E2 component (dihydrolipoamide acetyltransferase)